MNRSILIVICDFIITSMIYLNGGFSGMQSPFHDGGAATIDRSTVEVVIAELEAQRAKLEAERAALLASGENQQEALQKLTGDLAQTRAKLEFMERRAKLTREEAGPLSAEAVQKELESEIVDKNLVKAQYEQTEEELKHSQEQHANTMKTLAERSAKLETTQDKLKEASNQVSLLNDRLSDTKTALNQAETQVGTFRQKLGSAEANVAFLQGRSSAMEAELNNSRTRLAAAEQRAKSNEVKLAATQTQLSNMQNVVKDAMSARNEALNKQAETSSALEAERAAKTKLEGELKLLTSQLKTAEEKLRSDVLKRYTGSAVLLQHSMREARLLLDRQGDGSLYLPAVRIGKRNYLVSALRTLAGMDSSSASLGEVVELSCRVKAAAAPATEKPTAISGPLRVDANDCRVALLEIPDGLTEPLTLLTREELKQRGIQDLYLFKVTSFGKDSTLLNERCSMSFDKDDDYLYIRNGARVSSELKAEVGDLVLTKQGELVAVVVALEEYDFGRQVEARCFTFRQQPDVEKLSGISLSGPNMQKVCQLFAAQINRWLEQAKPLDEKRHRR